MSGNNGGEVSKATQELKKRLTQLRVAAYSGGRSRHHGLPACLSVCPFMWAVSAATGRVEAASLYLKP